MPMTKWSGSSKGLITFENDVFQLHFDIVEEDQETLYQWTKEICEYRLHQYFERRDEAGNNVKNELMEVIHDDMCFLPDKRYRIRK